MNEQVPVFPDERREEYTILAPDMLPYHFEFLAYVMRGHGYHIEILHDEGREVIDEGLKHCNNDACFPALCVIGQYLHALKSGKYDLDRTALLITQTGGGCRASNYLSLVRKALMEEFPQVPVLSLNFSSLEKGNSLKLTPSLVLKLAYCVFYGDLIMTCFNQTKPYEKTEGDCARVREECSEKVKKLFDSGAYRKLRKNARMIAEAFAAVPYDYGHKTKVGIVGEIYVKYSPLGNSRLVDFLLSEGCEPVVPALLDFVLYCIVNTLNDAKLYGKRSIVTPAYRIVYRWAKRKQRIMNEVLRAGKRYEPFHEFEHLRSLADKVINQGVKMGEGWLIPAEMAALAESDTENIVCAQPFGCLPNHIAGKGAVRSVKKLFPRVNIVPIDYDPSATKVNQENRIKLMLASARNNH